MRAMPRHACRRATPRDDADATMPVFAITSRRPRCRRYYADTRYAAPHTLMSPRADMLAAVSLP